MARSAHAADEHPSDGQPPAVSPPAHPHARRGLVWSASAALTAAALVPVVVLGILLVGFQQRSLTARAAHELDALADAQLARLELLESSATTVVELTASRTQMREDLVALLDGELDRVSGLERILADAVVATPALREARLLAPDGRVVVSTDADARGGPTAFGPGSSGPIDSRVLRVGDELRWLVSGPVELDGEVIGGLVLELDVGAVREISRSPTEARGTSTTCVWFRDADGAIMPFEAPLADGNRCPNLVVEHGSQAPEVAQAIALRGERRLLLDGVDANGVHVVAATRYLPSLDWGLTVTVPRAELLAPLRAAIVATVVLTAAVAIIAALASVPVARRVTRPIRSLRDVAEAAREGSPVHADEAAPGELGDLAVSLNDLTRTVRSQQRDLERRYEDLEVVTHAMAHDLRTPLTSIRGTLESLAPGRIEDPAVRARLFERGVAATIRLEQLIDDLLELIRTIGDPVELAPVALDEVVGAAVDQLGLGDVVEVGELPVVVGDRVLLERLVANLLSNAAKFHPEGAELYIAVSADAPAGGRVDVHVDDGGVGIPPEERDAVLDSFARGTRSLGVAGSGLGLAIASQVAQRHHGTLRIDESPLGGARVTVRLPVHRPGPREGDAFS